MSFLWQHSDERGMSAAIVAAIARAARPNGWAVEVAVEPFKFADLRALLVATMFLVDEFSTEGPHVTTGAAARTIIGERAKHQFAGDRANVARVLLETWRTIVVATSGSNVPPLPAFTPQFSTSTSGPAKPITPVQDAGFGWPVAAVAIVGVTIQAGVICYCADKIAIVIDNELTRREATRQMVEVHARVLAILQAHREAEKVAGVEQPLTEAEKAALAAVSAAQVQAQKSIKLEVPSLFPNLKDQGKGIVAAASSLGWGALAVIAALGYVFLTKGK